MRVTHRPARFGGRASRPDLLQPGDRKVWRYATEVGPADVPCPSRTDWPACVYCPNTAATRAPRPTSSPAATLAASCRNLLRQPTASSLRGAGR